MGSILSKIKIEFIWWGLNWINWIDVCEETHIFLQICHTYWVYFLFQFSNILILYIKYAFVIYGSLYTNYVSASYRFKINRKEYESQKKEKGVKKQYWKLSCYLLEQITTPPPTPESKKLFKSSQDSPNSFEEMLCNQGIPLSFWFTWLWINHLSCPVFYAVCLNRV